MKSQKFYRAIKIFSHKFENMLKALIVFLILSSFAVAYPAGIRKAHKNIQGNDSSLNYYVSSSIGDDNRSSRDAANPNTPWKSLKKLNAQKFNPGDKIFLKRGDTFYGSLKIMATGTKDKPIEFDAYGDGPNPVISGATSLDKWSQLKDGIWSAALPQTPGYVFQGDQLLPVSKYPNDYLVIDSVLSPKSFRVTGNVNSSWVGATAGVQFVNWAMGFQPIVSVSSNVITLESAPQCNSATGSQTIITKGRHFFLLNHTSLFSKNRDWAYDSNQKLFFIRYDKYPGTIEVSEIQAGIDIEKSENIIVQNIDIEKIADAGVKIISNSSSIYLNNIHIKYVGNTGINIYEADHVSVINCTVNFSGINGIMVNSPNNIVNNCEIRNINIHWETIYPFTAYLHSGIGLFNLGDNNDLSSNIIDSTGYDGILFWGKNTKVFKNRISNYCLLLVDGGGIYTSGANSGGSIVNENYVKQTAFNDPNLQIEGIYLDDKSQNCTVQNNTIIGNHFGVFLHNAFKAVINNNIIQNPLYAGIFSQHDQYPDFPVGSHVITGNDITVNRAKACCIGIVQQSFSDILGTIDKNTYKSVDTKSCFLFHSNKTGKNYNFNISQWQNSGYDKNSAVK